MDFEDSFHSGKRLVRFYRPCPDRLGAVHTGTASESDDGVASVLNIQFQRFRYIDSSRIGYRTVVKRIGDFRAVQRFFKTFGKSQFHDSLICDDEDPAAFVPADDIGKFTDAADDLRLPVWKERDCNMKDLLKGPAVDFS